MTNKYLTALYNFEKKIIITPEDFTPEELASVKAYLRMIKDSCSNAILIDSIGKNVYYFSGKKGSKEIQTTTVAAVTKQDFIAENKKRYNFSDENETFYFIKKDAQDKLKEINK